MIYNAEQHNHKPWKRTRENKGERLYIYITKKKFMKNKKRMNNTLKLRRIGSLKLMYKIYKKELDILLTILS